MNGTTPAATIVQWAMPWACSATIWCVRKLPVISTTLTTERPSAAS